MQYDDKKYREIHIIVIQQIFDTPHSVYTYNIDIERDDSRSAVSGSTRQRSAMLGSRSYTARTEVSHGQSSRTPRIRRTFVSSCHCRRTSMRSWNRFSRPVDSREFSDRYRGSKTSVAWVRGFNFDTIVAETKQWERTKRGGEWEEDERLCDPWSIP